MIKEKLSQFFRAGGLVMMYGSTIIMITTFYLAFFNPEKKVIIDINYFNEAVIEGFILIPLIFIVVSIAFVIFGREVLKR